MATARPFADMLAQFLTIYLPLTRACSPNTVSAYRDAFTLFLGFMDQQQATSPDQVAFADFTTSNVAAFLGWLRTDRQCCTATANQRLAAAQAAKHRQWRDTYTDLRSRLDPDAPDTPARARLLALGIAHENSHAAFWETLADAPDGTGEAGSRDTGGLHTR